MKIRDGLSVVKQVRCGLRNSQTTHPPNATL